MCPNCQEERNLELSIAISSLNLFLIRCRECGEIFDSTSGEGATSK